MRTLVRLRSRLNTYLSRVFNYVAISSDRFYAHCLPDRGNPIDDIIWPIHGHFLCDGEKLRSPVKSGTAMWILFCFHFVRLFLSDNAMHSSIGQNIKSPGVSGLRSPVSDVRSKSEKLRMANNSATRHPIPFMFGSTLGFLARTD